MSGSLVTALRSVLAASNQEHSARCGGLLAGWVRWDELHNVCSESFSDPGLVKPQELMGPVCWEALPHRAWFEGPLGSRAAVGHDLLGLAWNKATSANTVPDPSVLSERPDLWESPFTVGFLSVGYRRFRSSIPGVSEFLEKYRPDVLFLGDLGTSRNKIGRLKLQFEEGVHEEWFQYS